MKIIRKYTITAGTLLLFTLLTACERTELCYDHFPKAAITFAWEHEWERDYGMGHLDNWDTDYIGLDYDYFRPETPEWVNLIKYKDNNPYGEHYFSPEGGDVVIKEKGQHSFLLFNGDTEYIVLSDIASLSEARASATPRSRASISYIMEKHPGVRSSNPPDILYSAFIKELPSIEVHESKPLPIKMQPLVYTYIVRYEFEYGLDKVSLARGALAGMAESVYLRDGRTSDDPIIVLYDCDIKDYGCEAHVRSFGVPGFPDEYYGRDDADNPARPYTLNLEVLLKNGKTVEFNYDIADQLKKQPRGGVITVSGIRIEDEIGDSDSGFQVDVTDWPDHDVIDLPIEVEP